MNAGNALAERMVSIASVCSDTWVNVAIRGSSIFAILPSIANTEEPVIKILLAYPSVDATKVTEAIFAGFETCLITGGIGKILHAKVGPICAYSLSL